MAALTHRSDAWSWWNQLGNPQKVLAPMVGASERAFRMLCRRHGCDLAVTPMIHARLFGECDKLRRDVLRDLEGSVEAGDRPLLAQLCGDDKDVLLECARVCQHYVDGIDLNLGCPQGIAKRGPLRRVSAGGARFGVWYRRALVFKSKCARDLQD